MTRVATIPLQRTLSTAIQRSQQSLSNSQLQLTNGKKANDYAGLGTSAVRTISARSMMAQQQSYKSVAERVSTTLKLYNANITQIDTSMADLRKQLATALGSRNSPGLQHLVESTYTSVQASLNAKEAGLPLFAGSQTGERPMVPETLADFAATNPDDVFVNDHVLQSGRMSDGMDVKYGIVASDLGTNLMPVFKTLADAGPFGDYLTDAQVDAVRKAISEIDNGLLDVRNINAENGRKQQLVDTLKGRAADREILLTGVIGSVEDADLAQVAFDISQRQVILEASYSVFAQLSTLSLTKYLR